MSIQAVTPILTPFSMPNISPYYARYNNAYADGLGDFMTLPTGPGGPEFFSPDTFDGQSFSTPVESKNGFKIPQNLGIIFVAALVVIGIFR